MAAPTDDMEAAQSFGVEPCLSGGGGPDPEDAEACLRCFPLLLPKSDRNEALACLSHHDWNVQQAVSAARAIEDAISNLRAAKEAGWLTRDEYYQEYVELLRQTAAAIVVQCVVQRCLRRTELVRQTAAVIVVQCVVRRKKRCTELLRQTDAVIAVQRFWRNTEAKSFAATFAARFRSAENSLALEETKRQFSQPMVTALLDALSRDPDVAMFCAFNDFRYFDKRSNKHLVEREYWLEIVPDALSADTLALNPGLLGSDGLAILHVHYAEKWPWPRDRSRPVDLTPHRLVITQVNIRHTWHGSGDKFAFSCDDTQGHVTGPLHGKWREGHGEPVLVAGSGWKWTEEAEKGRSFTWNMYSHSAHRSERRVLTGQHASVLRDLLRKGEKYVQHGGRVVRKKFVDLAAHSPSCAGADGGEPLGSKSLAAAGQWAETDWSAKEAPTPIPRRFKILFVGVNDNERIQSQIDLKKEQQLIQDKMNRHFGDNDSKPEFKSIPHGSWGEVIAAVQEEWPTLLHIGCHALAKGSQAGVHLASGATSTLLRVKPWSRVCVCSTRQMPLHAVSG